MLNTIFAKKGEMKQWFDPAGRRLGVTALSPLPMSVSSLRTQDKNGYEAIALKLQTSSHKSQTKEVRVNSSDFSDVKIGTQINWAQVVKPGDAVKITGVSKGKGFAGVVKRHGFAGGPRTHGQSDRERAPGSIGSTTTPGRVLPGKRMAGRMGGETVTVSGLKVVAVDADKNMILVSGAVPGAKLQLVRIVKV